MPDAFTINPKQILDNYYKTWKEIIVPVNTGWTVSKIGSGSATMLPFYLQVSTGTTPSSYGLAYTPVIGLSSGTIISTRIDWAKDLEIEAILVRYIADSECIARFQLKEAYDEGALASKGIGVEIQNYTLIGEAYGTSRGTVNLGAMSDNRVTRLKIVKSPGRVEFWVGNSLAGKLTGDYVPEDAGSTAGYLVVSIKNGDTGGVNPRLYVSGIRIRQKW